MRSDGVGFRESPHPTLAQGASLSLAALPPAGVVGARSRPAGVGQWQRGKASVWWHSGEGAVTESNYGPFESSNYCGEGGGLASRAPKRARSPTEICSSIICAAGRSASPPEVASRGICGLSCLVLSSDGVGLPPPPIREGWFGGTGAFSALLKPKVARGSWGPTRAVILRTQMEAGVGEVGKWQLQTAGPLSTWGSCSPPVQAAPSPDNPQARSVRGQLVSLFLEG